MWELCSLFGSSGFSHVYVLLHNLPLLRRSFYHCGALLPCLEFCHGQIVGSSGRGGSSIAEQFSIQVGLLGLSGCAEMSGAARVS